MSVAIIVFYAIISIQVLYFIIFSVVLSRKREKRQDAVMPVSVIICAHDEESNLRELIPLLLAQDHPDFEVIIVEDRSNDNTYDFLLTETKKDERLKMVRVQRIPERMNAKKYALTLGIKTAKNDIILLTDADCRPVNNRWISTMARQFKENTQVVLGCSPYLKTSGFLNAFIRFETVMTALQYVGLALAGMPYMGVGRNMAYRKSFFLNKKGFSDIMEVTGGDDDLFVNRHSNRLNTHVCLEKDSVVYSIPKTNVRAFFYQKVRHLSAGKRYRFMHKLVLGLFSLTYILSWIGGIALLAITAPELPAIIFASLLALRTILVVVNTQLITKQLGVQFNPWPVVFLDFIYAFYYISTGVKAILTRRVKWTS